jgi:uncharacterized membrane protein YhaH (DUF805 family)
MKWYLKVLGDWTDFKTRSSRQEYWMFVLFNFLFSILAQVIDLQLGIEIFRIEKEVVGPVALVYNLAVFIPTLAVTVRRLHDIGKSGWYILSPVGLMIAGTLLVFLLTAFLGENFLVLMTILLGLIFLGILVWFITLMATPGKPGPNKWGDNPNELPTVKEF